MTTDDSCQPRRRQPRRHRPRRRQPGRRRRLSAALALTLTLALLPVASAGAVVEPGDPIENITPGGDDHSGGGLIGADFSDDGNLVVFESEATNLTADPDNGTRNIFLIDRAADTTINITAGGNGYSSGPRISADGSTVVFASHSTNLTADVDTGSDRDIFSYDVPSGVMTRITPDNVSGSSGSRMGVSGDGSMIAFTSFANLDGQPSAFSKAFLWDGTSFTRLTLNISANTYFATISDDASTVFFSVAVPGQYLWEWDVATGTRTPIGPGGFATTSADASMVAFFTTSGLTIMDRSVPGSPTYTNVPGQVYDAVISGDGNHLIMTSPGAGFVSLMHHYDINTAVKTRLIPGIVNVDAVGINHDGSVIGFVSDEPNITNDPDNAKRDVYVMFENPATCEGAAVTVDLNFGQTPTQGDDVIMGTEGDDVIYGLGGNDIICGHIGDDFIVGGAGDDVLYGGRGMDTVYGSIGDDTIYGGALEDDLRGGGGNDEIWAQAGGGSIFGGSGDDTIHGGPDADDIQAGTGNDSVWGYGGEDTIRGLGGTDTLYGGADNDLVVGGGGPDTIYGGSGEDILHGHTGNDFLYGESGNDVLQGGEGNDELAGGADSDTLAGAGGIDTLFGGAGDDDLLGGAGSDDLSGGSGVDDCHGQADTDTEDGTCETVISVP